MFLQPLSPFFLPSVHLVGKAEEFSAGIVCLVNSGAFGKGNGEKLHKNKRGHLSHLNHEPV